jgi:hypothetical protein
MRLDIIVHINSSISVRTAINVIILSVSFVVKPHPKNDDDDGNDHRPWRTSLFILAVSVNAVSSKSWSVPASSSIRQALSTLLAYRAKPTFH